jgi:3-oxoisoapionate decarboxylase
MIMNNKLGISSFAYYWAIQRTNSAKNCPFSAWDMLDKATMLELEVLQICENLPLVSWSTRELERLGNTAQDRGLTLEVGARGLDVDNLKTHIQIAYALGAHLVRLTPWSGSETRQPDLRDKLYQAVDQILPLCWKHDLTLAIENYFDLPDEELADFVQQVNDRHVGVCLDTANSVGLLEKPSKTVELLAPFVVSLHLKDFVVTKPAMGYVISGVPLGQGWLDAQAVLDVIHQADRHPNILLELWMDPDESKEATLIKEEMWVRQSVDFARHHLSIGSVQKNI